MKYFYIATLCVTISSGMIFAVPYTPPNNPPPFIDPSSYGGKPWVDPGYYGSPPFIDPRYMSKRINPDEVILNITDANGTAKTIHTTLTTPIYMFKNQLAYSTTLLFSLGTSDQIQLSINGNPLDDNKTIGDYITQATMNTTIINLTGKNRPIVLIKQGENVPKPVIGIGSGSKASFARTPESVISNEPGIIAREPVQAPPGRIRFPGNEPVE